MNSFRKSLKILPKRLRYNISWAIRGMIAFHVDEAFATIDPSDGSFTDEQLDKIYEFMYRVYRDLNYVSFNILSSTFYRLLRYREIELEDIDYKFYKEEVIKTIEECLEDERRNLKMNKRTTNMEDGIKLHVLKIKEEYYKKVKDGIKTFELRKNDRDFQIGDLVKFNIVLESGEIIDDDDNLYLITYILKDVPNYGLDKDYVIFGIREVDVCKA